MYSQGRSPRTRHMHVRLQSLTSAHGNDRTAAVIAHSERTPRCNPRRGGPHAGMEPRPGDPVSLDDVRLWLTEMCQAHIGPSCSTTQAKPI